MSEPLNLHPAELAYVFSYMKVGTVIGWGPKAFLPPGGGEADDAWYTIGRDRLLADGRLVAGKEAGRHRFTDEMLAIATALSDPQLVLLAQRREGDGVRTLTLHVHDTDVVELSKRGEDQFQAQLERSFSAAAGAAAAFVGASRQSVGEDVRIEANHRIFSKLDDLADEGEVQKALPALMKLGANEEQAKSVLLAFARPKSCGVVSLMYCAANSIQDAETYSVLTNAAGHTWVVFPPADAEGPAVLERSSLGSLVARIVTTASARMMIPG